MTVHQKVILYADDDADDREFLADALKEANANVEIVFAENGLQALEYLKTAKENKAGIPCLIVLDLNMPFLDGKETFNHIREDNTLQRVPVIVFSSSEKPTDKALFNSQGIEYFIKPNNLSFMNSIASHMVNVCC